MEHKDDYKRYKILVEPKIRFGHTAVTYKYFMYIFGGWDGQVTLNDLSVFDVDAQIWLEPVRVSG